MAEHEHGTMDTTTQERAFEGFISAVSKSSIAIIILLVLMAVFII